jgi:hypothetical protein
MTRSRAIFGGFLMGMLAFVGLAAVLLLALSQASAAPAAQTTPPTTNGAGAPAADGAKKAADASDAQHYADLLTQNMAAQLGVDQTRLNAAFTAAANATLAQAVKDGKLEQAQADKMKTQTDQGLSALLISGFRLAGDGPADKQADSKPVDDNGAMGAALAAAQAAMTQRLGMTADQLQSALQGGQTLEAVAQAHNVTLQQVKDAALAAAQAALTAGVQSGKWTQAQADGAYQTLSQNADNFLHKIAGGGNIRVAADDARTTAVFQAVQDAIAPLFGMTSNQLMDAIKNGQTLQALEQAHNVTEQQMKDAALAAAQAALTAGVQSGKWTQAQAAETVTALPQLVNDILKKLSSIRVPTDNSATK